MTKTKLLLDQLAKGPQTAEEIAEATGYHLNVIRRAIWNMRFSGYIDTAPETYTLSPKGTVRQMTKPKTPKADLDRRAAKRRAEIKDASGMVERSIRANADSALFNLGRQA